MTLILLGSFPTLIFMLSLSSLFSAFLHLHYVLFVNERDGKKKIHVNSSAVNCCKQYISVVKCLDFEYSTFSYFSHLSSVMDFCSGLVAVFFFLDVISIQAADDSSKEDANKIQLNSRVANNSLHQLSSNFSIVQNRNSFSELKKSENIKILFPDSFVLQSSNTTNPILPIQSSNHVPSSVIDKPSISHIKPDTLIDTEFPSRSASPSFSIPLPYDHTTPTSNVPILSTSPPTDNDFTTSRSRIRTRILFPDSPFFTRLLQNLKTSPMSKMKTMSKYMCDEYIKEITGVSLEDSSPAVKISSPCENTNNLVVGGDNAMDYEFPHMVALGRGSPNFTQTCGGTLISHTWVLTAAHCTHRPEGGFTHAKLGITSLTNQGIILEVLNTTRHPDYKPPVLYNDIALTRLKNAVKFDICVQPACLYQRDIVPEKALVSGWGATLEKGTSSDQLQKGELNLVDNESCKIWYNISLGIPQGITPNMVCAGHETIDACQGDSGGPLQIIHAESNMYHVLGVTSFGSGCGRNVPGIYTRVSHYLKWIEDIVWSQEEMAEE